MNILAPISAITTALTFKFSSKNKLPKSQLKRSLNASLFDSIFYNITLGFGESFFPAYLMHSGMGIIHAGLITTIPLIFGALLQTLSPVLLPHFKSYKKWILTLGFCQIASLATLALYPIIKPLPIVILFMIISFYHAATLGILPAWNLWISELTPKPIQTSFFSLRNRLGQLSLFISFLVGGIFISQNKEPFTFIPFTWIFLGAAFCRAISLVFIYIQKEITFKERNTSLLKIPLAFQKLPNKNKIFLYYLLAMNFAVQLASPFFTPFMLGPLQFSYHEFTLLICVSTFSKILFYPFFSNYIKKKGALKLLWKMGLGVALVPILWCFNQSFYFLLLVQAITGIVWAGHELAALLLTFENLKAEVRVSVLGIFQLINSFLISFSSFIGALILDLGPSGSKNFYFLALFLLSTAGRSLVVYISYQSGFFTPKLIKLNKKAETNHPKKAA